MPILAGMPPAYMTKALQDYARRQAAVDGDGALRQDGLHLGVADVAAYFAAQKREPWPGRHRRRGGGARQGRRRPVRRCHGADGRGDLAKNIPDLRGQPPGYLENQMRLFKADQRSPGDESLKAAKALMKTIPDNTFADLAAFFATQR